MLSYLCNLQNTNNKPGQPSRKRAAGKNSKAKENGRNHQDGETESEEEDSKVTDECSKLQDTTLAEKEPSEMANGHEEQEEKPSVVDVKTEALENGGGESMEMNGGGEEEKVGTLQNGAHESCGEGQEKDEKEKEASLGQNRRARGKVVEGKTELMCTPAVVLTFTCECLLECERVGLQTTWLETLGLISTCLCWDAENRFMGNRACEVS